jgi:hypothetical protein
MNGRDGLMEWVFVLLDQQSHCGRAWMVGRGLFVRLARLVRRAFLDGR